MEWSRQKKVEKMDEKHFFPSFARKKTMHQRTNSSSHTMNIFIYENFFANSSFFFLFLSMISYWVQIAFHVQKWNIGRIAMVCANFCLLSLLILRWKESGHFPLSNLYESLMFLSWSVSTFHFLLENAEKRFFVGALTSPTALFINAFATFRLPLEMQQSSPLVPALQSNWLMMHVTVMILSYSALICGSLLSIAFLIVTKNVQFDLNVEKSEKKEKTLFSSFFDIPFIFSFTELRKKETQIERKNGELASPEGYAFSSDSQKNTLQNKADSLFASSTESFIAEEQKRANTIPNETQMQMKKQFAENLDNLSYRILGIGFPLLTIGILSGAVWANEAWGSYWSWDPKETWAFATWLVFAIYFHLRISKGWQGKKPAILATVGFVTVWICFLGVNLLGEGLHSYGFLKDSI
jgi:cytochrome c-type biogenesis protein CcsB